MSNEIMTDTQLTEVLQSIVETRRQTIAQFEQRMRQDNQLFQTTMQMMVQNQESANARENVTAQQQNSYTNQQAQQSRAASTAEHYADVGAITIIP